VKQLIPGMKRKHRDLAERMAAANRHLPREKAERPTNGGFVRFGSLLACPFFSHATGPLSLYALVDPRDETARYIGITKKRLGARLRQHLSRPTNARVIDWLVDLKRAGLKPEIRLIVKVTRESWQSEEMRWIAWAKRYGRLLNVDPGGKFRDRKGRVREGAQQAAEEVQRQVNRLGAFGGPVASHREDPLKAVKPGPGQVTDHRSIDPIRRRRATSTSDHRNPPIPAHAGTPGVGGAGEVGHAEEGAGPGARST